MFAYVESFEVSPVADETDDDLNCGRFAVWI